MEKETYKSVVNTRINNEIKFNLEDSFDVYGDGLCTIEQVYFNYSEHVNNYLKICLIKILIFTKRPYYGN